MTFRRDEFGRGKHSATNRDYRRAHIKGAHNMVLRGEKAVESFPAWLVRILKRTLR